jgi:8-oxo-dGTP diphosphatase
MTDISKSSSGAERKRQGKMKQVVAALIIRENTILICQRTADQAMPLKWEFPGGKVEPDEDLKDALHRELDEELGIDAVIGPRVAAIQHTYRGGNALELHFFRVDHFKGELQNRIFQDVRWVDCKELKSFDFLEADTGLVKNLSAGKLL